MTHTHDACGCSPETSPDAVRPDNAPGLDRVAYRIAPYPASMARLRAGLAAPDRARQLDALTTREPDDPAMGLLDATAVVADILSFYSERIANEGFLRTALERRSVLELGREIGYELGPGLAAEAWLVFGVEDRGADPSRPAQAVVPAGAKVQSVPLAGGRPQTFETRDELVAQAAWNELRLVATAPQAVDNAAQTIYLAGTATGVAEGDVLLVAVDPSATGAQAPGPRIVHRVAVEADRQRTRIELAAAPQPAQTRPVPQYHAGVLHYGAISTLTEGTAAATVGQSSWSEEGLSSLIEVYGWETWQLAALYAPHAARPPDLGPADPGVFAFKVRASVFGHNAPRYDQLPSDVQTAYPIPWDTNAEVNVTTDSQGGTLTDPDGQAFNDDTIHLDTTYKVAPGSWVVVSRGSPGADRTYRIAASAELSVADYAISGKVTQLTLQGPTGGAPGGLTTFKPRWTTVYAGSSRLELADVPLPVRLEAESTAVTLDRLVPGLAVGRTIAVGGDRADLPGTHDTEVVVIRAIDHAGGLTTLTFGPALQHPYVRATVVVNANVVRATHGETVAAEVLGSGTGAADQRFRLRRPPVTHLSAPTGTGAQSTLEVRVDGVAWAEAPSLEDAGPRDELFLARRDDDGTTTVVFGDGVNGARPQTGAENVTARYRTGIGLTGEVGPRTLILLAARPPGVRDVTNPLAAAGAEDPESRVAARVNAPLAVTTLGRVVSLTDYEDFARAFGGIGKARATLLWRGEKRVIHLTVAGPGGAPVPDGTIGNLRTALDDARDPGIPVEIAGYAQILVRVRVDLLVDPRLEEASVVASVRSALGAELGFDQRDFATALTEAEVVSIVMGVAGLRDVRLLALYQVLGGAGDPTVLRQDPILARNARWTGTGMATAPAELVVLEPAGAIVEVRTS